MSDDEARYTAMVEFLSTFPTLSGAPPECLADLSDGVALFEVLSEIAPDYFDPTTIARHLGDNWALKSSNLRKLIRNLECYYHEELNKDAPFSSLNLSAIARQSDLEALSDLVELVAAAAVTCPEKGEYVGRIMSMTPESQIQMKTVIQRSLGKLEDYEDEGYDDEEGELDVGDNENELVFDGDDSPRGSDDDDENKNLFGSGHLKKSHGGDFDEQKEELEKALMDARRELAAHKSQSALLQEDNEKAQNKLSALVEDLQDRLVSRQDDLITAENDLRYATSDLDEAKSKVIELSQQKEQLADELDVANARAEQLRKAEATVIAYRKKLESVGVMNQQMTDLEDQAANYLRQIMDLESEVKKSASLQKSVDNLQSKLNSLENQKSSTDGTIKSSASEISDLKSRLQAAENSQKMYEEELIALREEQKLANIDTDMPAVEGLSLNNSSGMNEKSMRLQFENKKLKEEIEKYKAASASGKAAQPAQVQRLKEEIAKKEKETLKIRSDKDKLETYTKKTLAKFQDKYLVALQECKAKLKEKQDKIEALENRSSSEKTAQKREERLLSSALYELGLAIMQNRLKER